METRAAAVSPLYLLERFEPGIVHLDKQRHVIGMNDFARRVLPVDEKQPFDQMVLDFHPDRSRPKVEFLLDQAAQCPVAAPPPMTMIINIPERVLLIKVSRMSDATAQPTGYVLVFYDITDVVASKDETQPSRSDARRRLLKIPTVAQNRIVFVDADDILCIRSDGHYTRVITAKGNLFCNLAIGDIETRLDPPPRQNTCRPDRTKNLGVAKKEWNGTIRTGVQGPSGGAIAAAGECGAGGGVAGSGCWMRDAAALG